MPTIYIKDRAELFNKIKDALHNFKDFNVCYKRKSVNVTTDDEGYIRLSPHNQSVVWDSRFIDDYIDEIVSDVKYTLFKNKNLVLVSTMTDCESQKKWFYDRRNEKIFYVSNGKVSIKTAQEAPFYDEVLQETYDMLGINRVLITDDYKLCEDDLKAIRNTDINPEDFRKDFIRRWKGKTWHRNMARYVANDFAHKYKYYVHCDHCGKEFFIWMKHIPGAFVDHFGPDFCCKECEDQYNEKHKQELAEQRHQLQEAMKGLDFHIQRIKMPSTVRSEIFEEKPMSLPTDKLNFAEPMLIRTRH